MSRKRNDKGQFKTKYDWPVLIPKICTEFINGVSLYNICAQPGYPSPWAVWNAIKHNSEYREQWRCALRAQMYILDGGLMPFAGFGKLAGTASELTAKLKMALRSAKRRLAS